MPPAVSMSCGLCYLPGMALVAAVHGRGGAQADRQLTSRLGARPWPAKCWLQEAQAKAATKDLVALAASDPGLPPDIAKASRLLMLAASC